MSCIDFYLLNSVMKSCHQSQSLVTGRIKCSFYVGLTFQSHFCQLYGAQICSVTCRNISHKDMESGATGGSGSRLSFLEHQKNPVDPPCAIICSEVWGKNVGILNHTQQCSGCYSCLCAQVVTPGIAWDQTGVGHKQDKCLN